MRDEILSSPIKSSKKIIWIHNDLKKTAFKNYTDEELRKFFGFDKIMVISDKIKLDFENLVQNLSEKDKIVRIYNPIDTEEISVKSNAPISNYVFSKTLKTFVSVGTVFPQKGFDRLLKVHQRLLEEGLAHKILIIGNGYDFEKIQKLKNELGVDQTVTMLGFTDNPYPYFKKADFYMLSSRYEGFPTVLFEAISLKKKIIATDVSGVKEMLENGKLGLIVENSEDGIYAGMKKALINPESFDGYAEELQSYTMPFNLENSVNSIIPILDEI